MNYNVKLTINFIAAIGIGLVLGNIGYHFWPDIKQVVFIKPYLYHTQDPQLQRKFDGQKLTPLTWGQLIPKNEKHIIERYQSPQASQPTSLKGLSDQLFLSLQASSDTDYLSALQSSNTVSDFNDKAVAIAGYLVPLDYHDDKSIANLFIVPYFGACIHFPPPPPNQILFARLDSGFKGMDLNQAYKVYGILQQALFEDELGTSAYMLDVVAIEAYYGEPDDVRQH
jgi:hypothetical protein